MTVVYYPGWGIYGRNHFINDIDFNDVTEISYAFFDVEANGDLRTIDPYEWSDKAFTASESVSGVADTWEPGSARGNQNQFAQLAQDHPDVGINIALGGWTLSDEFSNAVLDQNRGNLVDSIVDMARENPWITGFDLDWEFPGSGGAAGNAIRPEDGANYGKLIQELGVALEALSGQTGQEYSISVASPPGLAQVDTFGFENGVAEHVDVINLMAYDYHGGWEAQTGLQAGIFDDYSNTSSPGIAATIAAMVERGVDIEQVNLGIPLYARGWTIDPATGVEDALGAPSRGLVSGSFEAGIYDAKDILAEISANPSAWTVVYDTDAMAAFALSTSGEFVSIETRSTVALKAAWAEANDFNGLMFWDSSSDFEGDGLSLVEAGNDVWEGRLRVADVVASDPIQFDQFIGSGAFYDLLTLDPTGTPLPADQAQQNLDAQAAETDFGVGDGEGPGDDMPDMDGDPMDGDPMDGGHMGGGGHDMPMPTGDGSGADNPEITAQNATHVISWAWGQNTTDTDFDPTTDTLFFNWMSADNVEVSQTAAGVVIALPANQQSLTLAGLTLADMDLSNIHALDPGLRDELAGLIADKSVGGGMGDDQVGDHDHGGMTGTMTMVTLTSADQIIADFIAATDMVHIEDGITADRLQIFEESGDVLGLTTRIVVLDDAGDILSTTIVQGVGLSDLTLANFSIAEQSAQNEVAAAIGQTISAPTSGTGGYDVVYDSDGSNPAGTTGASPQGGIKYRGEINADDVVGFNPALDQIDVGGTSVHGLIFTKTPSGEFAIDSPWTDAIQIFQGVQMADLTMANFAAVGNEHLRQDVGGVMSWELGVGPRESDTVYIRSHEYGVHEVVDGFDPSSMKISFLYFGTRERLMVEDTDAGLKIWSMPTGQSMTFTDVTKADLIPGLIEFHHDQIIEDNLETPFGMAAGDLTLVDRTVILTPEGPPGATTDGFQTQIGELTGATVDVGEPIDTGGGGGGGEPPDTGGGQSGSIAGFTPVDFANGQTDTVALTWAWATKTAVTGFEPETDHFDFGGMSEEFVDVWEDGGNLYFEVIGNGGNITALVDIQAEDLSASTLKAAGWNDVLDADSSVIQSLVNLGLDFG